MSTIAWDGSIIAADRKAVRGNMVRECSKMHRLEDGTILAFAGTFYHIPVLVDWYMNGCSPDEYPDFQDTDDYTDMVVIKDGKVFEYQRGHLPIEFSDVKQAWGSGRDFALAAMACGRSAIEAIEIASMFDVYTGLGVDHYQVL